MGGFPPFADVCVDDEVAPKAVASLGAGPSGKPTWASLEATEAGQDYFGEIEPSGSGNEPALPIESRFVDLVLCGGSGFLDSRIS
jgi:hypothetical protein